MDKLDDRAMVAGLDFIVAIVLVLAAVMMAILVMPSMSHEDRSWRIKQYMVATRATDNLVQNEGQEGWVANWTPSNYSKVTKIGFVYPGQPKVLDRTKIDTMMAKNFIVGIDGTSLPWWEFPNFSKLLNDREIERLNATRALGLDGYNFYMRLYPVGLNNTNFDYSRYEINLSDRSKVPMIENSASAVDRYLYINSSIPSCHLGLGYEEKYICYDNKTVHYRLNLWVW